MTNDQIKDIERACLGLEHDGMQGVADDIRALLFASKPAVATVVTPVCPHPCRYAYSFAPAIAAPAAPFDAECAAVVDEMFAELPPAAPAQSEPERVPILWVSPKIIQALYEQRKPGQAGPVWPHQPEWATIQLYAAPQPPQPAQANAAKYDPQDPGNWRDGDDACGDAAVPDDERAAFEAWRDKHAFNMQHNGLAAEYAWSAWQARAAPQPVAQTAQPQPDFCSTNCKTMCQNSTHGVCDGTPATAQTERALTAMQRYTELMEGESEPDPVERLRFFCSLAMSGQDWIDVEQFFDAVTKMQSERALTEIIDARKAMLERLEAVQSMDRQSGGSTLYDHELAGHKARIFIAIDGLLAAQPATGDKP